VINEADGSRADVTEGELEWAVLIAATGRAAGGGEVSVWVGTGVGTCEGCAGDNSSLGTGAVADILASSCSSRLAWARVLTVLK
jgi:hypothetical protein